jgi:uncharacterized protein YjbI with pentapeptide repeats
MPPEELTKLLQSHQLWLSSGGKEGQRAVLEDGNFGAAIELRGADLRNAILNRAEFKNANLTKTNLQGAELRRASFDGAILRETNLREADLQNANLESADFLLTAQLAGANVAGAKLPKPIAEFEGLKTIAEATSNAQKLFVAMLGGCIYSWLTIGTTTDAALLTNSASSPLPIIGTALPIVGFYLVTPVVLLALYFYFHLNMQRLWEALADLPAVFPDGRNLDKRADPWLLNRLVSAHFVRLRQEHLPLSRLERSLSIVLAWWIVPATLFVFWSRFLPRHDWFGTTIQIGLLVAATGFGFISYHICCSTLRGTIPEQFRRAQARKNEVKRLVGSFGLCAIGAMFYLVSFGAINGIRYEQGGYEYAEEQDAADSKAYTLPRLVPRILQTIGFSPFADVFEADLSIKPSNWSGQTSEYPLVKGARLDGANMNYANAGSAFLVNAQLRGTKLHKASLWKANLSHAQFRSLTKISTADLSGADLSYADLSNADLVGVDLSHADLSGANLSDADLAMANLSGADLEGANLNQTDLTRVNLTEVRGLSKDQIGKAKNYEKKSLHSFD